jgi:3-dehydroquinate dehydratase II
VRPVLVLSGPNLGRLGTREPLRYGTSTYADVVAACEETAAELGLVVEARQTDDEATLLGWLHAAADGEAAGVVLNPAGLCHTSVVLRDAVAMVDVPVVEVHLTNIAAREEFRHHSFVSAVADGVVTGLGVDSYRLGLRAVRALLDRHQES